MPRQKLLRAPLLERLIDRNPDASTEKRPLRAYTVSELVSSICEEMERLLNSRCPLNKNARARRHRTTIDYGVPDFSHLDVQSLDDQAELAAGIRETIEIYEPRLRNVRVTITEVKDNEKALAARVDAIIAVESIREPVSFPIVVKGKGEKVHVYAF